MLTGGELGLELLSPRNNGFGEILQRLQATKAEPMWTPRAKSKTIKAAKVSTGILPGSIYDAVASFTLSNAIVLQPPFAQSICTG